VSVEVSVLRHFMQNTHCGRYDRTYKKSDMFMCAARPLFGGGAKGMLGGGGPWWVHDPRKQRGLFLSFWKEVSFAELHEGKPDAQWAPPVCASSAFARMRANLARW
jgi:hypothetical protein